jgi:predicted ABC-type ATPase
MKTVTNTPLLIIIRGLPGSGKTYIAEKLVKEFDAASVVSLDPDTINYESADFKQHVIDQTAEGVDPILHDYRYLRAKAYDAIIAHKVLIWNQPFTNLEILQKITTRLSEHAEEHGTKLSIIIVEVAIDPAVAKERVASRKAYGGHGPDDERFERFVNEYETSATLGYTVIPVNGSDDVAVSVTTILNHLS